MRSLTTPTRMAATALAVAALAAPAAVRADALSASAAQAALARGAVAWDVRSAPGVVIAGAVRAVPTDLQHWFDGGSSEALGRAVSTAGIDLSREVIVYGAAGDLRAQALHDGLVRLASGQVHWLVGGIDEWQAAGLPTTASAVQRLPVPQHLVLRASAAGAPAPAMAAHGLRRSEPALSVASVARFDERR
jgi:3-mercaptopyruvate sulfurtransferase SseA